MTALEEKIRRLPHRSAGDSGQHLQDLPHAVGIFSPALHPGWEILPAPLLCTLYTSCPLVWLPDYVRKEELMREKTAVGGG